MSFVIIYCAFKTLICILMKLHNMYRSIYETMCTNKKQLLICGFSVLFFICVNVFVFFIIRRNVIKVKFPLEMTKQIIPNVAILSQQSTHFQVFTCFTISWWFQTCWDSCYRHTKSTTTITSFQCYNCTTSVR